MRDFSRPDAIFVGEWHAVRATGELMRGDMTERLEPKVMSLLFLLAARPGAVLTKDEIMTAVWPGVIVGEDTLARAVSRLRKALHDDAKTPTYVETLPKRGYRLIAEVRPAEAQSESTSPPPPSPRGLRSWPIAAAATTAVALVFTLAAVAIWQPASDAHATLVERANDFYFQYTRADNEAAIALFERILTERPDYVPALAGLANALVQKVMRWPDEPGAPSFTKLADALHSGRMKTPASRAVFGRARALAERAVALSPKDAAAQKALGFVELAAEEFPAAIASYQRAVALDADAWGPLINIGDVLEITGRPRAALPYFERAYAAMTDVYDHQSVRVRPWYAELGVLIGDRHRAIADAAGAEVWYRRVLAYAPLHHAATDHLAALLRQRGAAAEAQALCANLKQRTAADCGL